MHIAWNLSESMPHMQGELRRREDGLMQIRQRLAARTIQRWWRRHCKKAKKAKKGKGKKKGKAGQATGAGKKAANQKPAGSAKQPGGGAPRSRRPVCEAEWGFDVDAVVFQLVRKGLRGSQRAA